MKINKKHVVFALAVISLAIFAGYLIFHIFRQTTPNTEYRVISEKTVYESVALDGAVFRDETVIKSDTAGVISTRADGEKVAAGAVVAQSADGNIVIRTSFSGYYYSSVDGRESTFSFGAADGLTPSKLDAMLSDKPDVTDASAGKVATGFSWRFAANTSYSGFKAGENYQLVIGETSVTVKAVYVSAEEGGVRTVVFESSGGHGAASTRNISAEAYVSHTGTCVPSSALRGSKNEKYVYTFENGRAVKYDVDVLFDDGENAVVTSKTDMIGKTVIIGGNLYDGKVLK